MTDESVIDLSADYTTFQLLEAARLKVDAFRNAPATSSPAVTDRAKRNYSLAITSIEDAQMRTTRGHAINQDKFAPADLEK